MLPVVPQRMCERETDGYADKPPEKTREERRDARFSGAVQD